MQSKVCTICKTDKALSEFHKHTRSRGLVAQRGGMGVGSWCKVCKAERRKPGLTAARQRAEDLAERGLKECTKCSVVKPIREFHVSRVTKDGRAYRCPDCVNANGRKWREENPDAYRLWSADKKAELHRRNRQWREQNQEHLSRSFAAWARANPDKINALVAKRNAAKKNALVPWANLEAVGAIYAEATRLTRETGVRHEVDHIYPLQGETICGLHWEGNLQILTKTENIRKKNRMPEEYEELCRRRQAA